MGWRRAGVAFECAFRRRVALLRPAAATRGNLAADRSPGSIGTAKGMTRSKSVVSRVQDELKGLGGRHLAAPRFELADRGVTALFVQFVESEGQVAQSGQDLGGSPF